MALLTSLFGGLLGLLARDAAPHSPVASDPPPAPPPAPAMDAAALYAALQSMGAINTPQVTPLQLYSTRPAAPADLERLFRPARPMPGVVPSDVRPMAMDDINNPMADYGGAGYAGLTEGMYWLGFPYLAEMAQRTEYRRISETIAKDMTRRWFRLQAKGRDDKSDKIAELDDCIKHHKLKEKFTLLALLDGFFGRSHLYIDVGQSEDRDLMKLPLPVDRRMIKKGGLKGIRVVEPMWCYPNNYNANDPLREGFYLPQTWWVMGKEIHRTRLLPFIAREMPDMLKPAYSFAGLSLSQMAKPYVDNWLRTRQSVSDLVHSFSTPVLQTNMGAMLNAGASAQMQMRAALFNYFRDNNNMMILDKTTEDFKNVSTPLGAIDHLQAQAQEHMASAVGIPLVVLLGISPSGLNATSEGELQVWAQFIRASQTSFYDPNLVTILNIFQLHLWGEIDPDITHAWEPLREMSEQEEAAARKSDADLDAVYVNAGVLSPDEIRQKLSGEADSPYQGLDLTTPAPTPPEQEPDPLAGGGGGPEGGGPPGGGGGSPPDGSGQSKPAGGSPAPIASGAGKLGPAGSPTAPDPSKGSRDADPNGLAPGEGHTRVVTQDPDAQVHVHLGQNDHGHIRLGADAFNPDEPRDASGRFGSGGGGAPNSLGDVEAHWDSHGISHALSENGDTITLSKIALPKSARGKGVGTKAMQSLTAYADKHGKSIALTPSTHFGATSVSRLTGFYKQFGFAPNKGKSRDFSTRETMIRRPVKLGADAWNEDDHDRAKNGQFGKGGGGGGNSPHSPAAGKSGEFTYGGTPVSGGAAGGKSITTGTHTFSKDNPATGSLHGVAFAPWKAPDSPAGWQAEADGSPAFDEPEVPALKGGRKQGAGVIIQEPDGRVWTIRPKGAYGGYTGTFPKGTVDKGDSLRSTAIKEAFEESGLRVQLTGFAGDAMRDTSQARYYYAKRIGGEPHGHGWETEGVTLAPPGELHQHLNRPIDRMIAEHTVEGADEHTPLDLSAMAKIGDKLGSNPGGQYEDASGRKFYAKESKSEDHAKNELLATRLYEAAHAPVLPIMPATVGGKLGVASEWRPKQNINIASKTDRKDAQRNFATHAWLANWDAPGLTHDNQARIDGIMHTVDTGGALNYRAQGGAKGGAFGDKVTEWESMRHPVPGTPDNVQAHELFGDMTPDQMRRSARAVTAVPSHVIEAMVAKHGPGDDKAKAALAAKLIARRDHIKELVAALPQGHVTGDAASSWAMDAMIGEWDEEAHPRAKGGQFTKGAGETGGGGGHVSKTTKPVPELTKYAGPSGAKMKQKVEAHIASGSDSPHALVAEMKAEAAKFKSSNVAGFQNQLIGHLEEHHGMKPGALGKAVKKKEGEPPEPGAPSEAEIEAMAPAEPEPPAGFAGAVPISAVHGIITGPASIAQKIDILTKLKAKAVQMNHDPAEVDAGLKQLNEEAAADPTEKAKTAISAMLTAAQGGTIPDPPDFAKGNGTAMNIHSMAKAGYTSSTSLDDYLNKGLASGSIKENSGEHAYAKMVIMAKMAQEAGATPAAPAAPAKPLPAPPVPFTSSKHQMALNDIATGAKSDAEKIQALKDYPVVQQYPDGFTAKFANSWIDALGGEPIPGVGFVDPQKPAAAAPAAPTAAAPKPAAPKATPATPTGTGLHTTPNQMKLARAKKHEAQAIKVDSAEDPNVLKACKTLNRNWWKKASVPAAAKAAAISYKGGSSAINGALREAMESDHAPPPSIQKEIDNIDELFEHDDAVLEHDLIVWRGEDMPDSELNKMIANVSLGKSVRPQVKGFMSTAASHAPPSGWRDKKVQWQITARKGTRALGLWAASSSFHGENEVILRHGTALEVYEIQKVPGKNQYIVKAHNGI